MRMGIVQRSAISTVRKANGKFINFTNLSAGHYLGDRRPMEAELHRARRAEKQAKGRRKAAERRLSEENARIARLEKEGTVCILK